MNFKFYILFIISGFVFTKPVAAQAYINLEGAQVFSTFKFSTKISDKDQVFTDNQAYKHITVGAFSLVYQYEDSNGFFILAGAGMRKAGSSLVYNNVDYIWKMQYADVKAGIGYQFNKWRIKPYEAVSPYYASLLNANQYIGQKNYDIKASKSIRNYDFGLFLALGAKATISKQISIFTEYNYILGLKNIETTAEQYLYNRGFSIKMGLSLNITSKSVEKYPNNKFELLAEKPEPVYNETHAQTLPPETNPVAETFPSKNPDVSSTITSPSKIEEPLIENNAEKPVAENKISSEPIVNDIPLTKTTPVIEDQSEKLKTEAESIKTSISENSEVIASTTKVSTKESTKSNINTVSPKNKLEKSPVASNRMPVQILFKIQIASVSKPLGINHKLLKNLSGKIEKEIGKDGLIHYYSGTFESYEEARSFLSRIKSKGGNEGAFVVAFKNGKQITVYEAKKLVEEY